MAQGYTGYNIIDVDVSNIGYGDSANLDAFSRLRVSNPLTIFSNQFTYDDSPLIFDKIITGGATINHDAQNRLLILDASPGEYVFSQSFEWIPYQPGRSQLVFITFNFFPQGGPVMPGNGTKVAGIGDHRSIQTPNGYDGIFFKYDTVQGPSFLIATSTANGFQEVYQSSWNIDKLDGTGASGITLDLTKIQILVIDFQALYSGRVRVGFDIDGKIIYCHEFLNANVMVFPYIATANLPICVGMTNLNDKDRMHFICCSVASEGGTEDSQRFGYTFSWGGVKNITYLSNTQFITALQPRAYFGGPPYENRAKFVLEHLEFLNIGKEPVRWYLVVGENIPADWINVNTTYSTMNRDDDYIETNKVFTTGIIVDQGYVPGSTGNVKANIVDNSTASKYPITLDSLANTRPFGTLSIWADMVEDSDNRLCYSIRWKEIR